MKKIILINDDIKKVTEIFGRIYKMLWKGKKEEGIAAEVIFFGDHFKQEKGDSDLKEENINKFNRNIKEDLMSHCEDEEQWDSDGEMYKEKKKLINNLSRIISVTEQNNEIFELIKNWRDEKQLNDNEVLLNQDFKGLIDLILKNTKVNEYEKVCILVDVMLLIDDVKRVKEGIPIISMGLYHALNSLGYTCYLYSSYVYDYLLMDKCIDVYKKHYKEDMIIYSSKDFFSEQVSSVKCLFYHLEK